MKLTDLIYFIVIGLLSFLTHSIHISHKAGGQIIDTTVWYRLTTQWKRQGKSLDIINDGSNSQYLQLSDSGNYTGQYWAFTAVPNYPGWYRLSTMFTGSKVLDIVNDSSDNKLWMTKAGLFFGQYWKLTKDNSGFYRITPMWRQTKAIGVADDAGKNLPYLYSISDKTGQLWKLTPIQKR